MGSKDMTPKEKANELVELFLPLVDYHEDDLLTQRERMLINAKECALISVNQIFKLIKIDDLCFEDCCNVADEWFYYWEQVKKEIDKL